MKTLKWILGILQVLAVGAIGKLLYDNFDTILLYFFVYPTNVVLTAVALILVILVICSLEINFTRKINLRNSFEVSKPVKKLTPDDFHITNYNTFYIERESDKEIEILLKERKYVFITGIPMLGKTRMAYEATKKLNDFYLLKPKYEKIDIERLKLPLFKKRIVLFLDDIDKYVGKFSIDTLIRKIKEKASDFVVITTCRSGKEFEHVFGEKEMENLLTQCQKSKIEPRLLEINEQKNLATEAGKDLNQIVSNGTPGSITIDLRYMKQRYEQLNEEKTILKCMKLLKNGNIFLWKENLLKQVSKDIFNLNIERTKWDDYIKSLLNNGFIKKPNKQINISHDVYLDDRFLDDYVTNEGELIKLKHTFLEYRDFGNLFYLGNSFFHRGKKDQALDCYQKCLKINPLLEEAHNNLGLVFKDLGRYEEAEKEYRIAIRIKPTDDAPHLNLGNLLRKLDRYEEAESEYNKVLQINPEDTLIYNNLGNLFTELKRYDKAEIEYRHALQINPNYAEAHSNLGHLFFKLEKYDMAEEELKIALIINPALGAAHCNLGELYIRFNRKDEAMQELEIAYNLFIKSGNNEGIKEAEDLIRKL